MKFLCAEIQIDGDIRKGVVVDVLEDGTVLGMQMLSELPCEPANTVYFGGRAEIENGKFIRDGETRRG